MRYSSRYRLGIVILPAEEEHLTVQEPVAQVHFLPLSELEVAILWRSGILAEINAACDARIDEYEEEAILPEKAPLVRKIASRALKRHVGGAPLASVLECLIDLTRWSERLNLPMVFVL